MWAQASGHLKSNGETSVEAYCCQLKTRCMCPCQIWVTKNFSFVKLECSGGEHTLARYHAADTSKLSVNASPHDYCQDDQNQSVIDRHRDSASYVPWQYNTKNQAVFYPFYLLGCQSFKASNPGCQDWRHSRHGCIFLDRGSGRQVMGWRYFAEA